MENMPSAFRKNEKKKTPTLSLNTGTIRHGGGGGCGGAVEVSELILIAFVGSTLTTKVQNIERLSVHC